MFLCKSVALYKLKSYQHYLRKEEYSENTIKRYVFDILQLIESLPVIITKNDLIDYKEKLKNLYKLSSVNVKINSINKYLSYLGYDSYKLKSEKRIYRIDFEKVFTKEDYFKMLNYCQEKNKIKMFYIMKCLAGTGIRISELKYITVENIRAGNAIIYNKKRERKIYFSHKLQNLLEEYCKLANIEFGVVFRGRNNKPITRTTINKNLNSIAIKTGINPKLVYPHAFRHLFAKEYINNNNNIFELSDLLGHASIETTRIYTKSTGEDKRLNLENLLI